MKRVSDDNWPEWQAGDLITWQEDARNNLDQAPLFTITRKDQWDRVFWIEQSEECLTRATNMVRVTFVGRL